MLPNSKSTSNAGVYESWFVDDPQSKGRGQTLWASMYALLKLRFPGFEWGMEAKPLESAADAPDVKAKQEFEGDVRGGCRKTKQVRYWFCLSSRVFLNTFPIMKDKLGANQFRPDLVQFYDQAKGLLKRQLEKKQA